jgi:threonine/homoserine/homoserine lactone efflux protein
MTAAYLTAVAVVVLTPGPDMLFCLASGLDGGARAGLRAALGMGSGEIVHIGAAAAGLGALLHAVPALFGTVRLAGAAYLALLAVRAFRDRDVALEGAAPAGGAYARGLTTNLLNPKMAMFSIAFLPTFVDPRGSVALQFLALGATFVAVDVAVGGAVGVLAGRLQRRLRRPRTRRALHVAAAAVLLGLSVRLAAN